MPTLKWLGEHVDTIYIRKDETRCANCAHFYQHYIKDDVTGRTMSISWGHCAATQRIKDRNAADTCTLFKAKE